MLEVIFFNGRIIVVSEVTMTKILMAILFSIISLSSFACGGGKDEEKKTELIVERNFF